MYFEHVICQDHMMLCPLCRQKFREMEDARFAVNIESKGLERMLE